MLVSAVLVLPDRLNQVAGSPIVHEKDALHQTPERCGPELISQRLSLEDIISQTRPHVM
jgi:hypothetical protein